jgi:hypothetical protein
MLKANTKYLLWAAIILLTAVCCAFGISGNDNFAFAKQEIMLRKIGHEILLHAGDSTSRVLPIKKLSQNEYQIAFENGITFQPDSVVKIISRSLAQNKLTHNYIVNVLNCNGTDAIFGYAILGTQRDNIIPCSGRKQPKSCYIIDLKFEESGITPVQKGYLICGLPLLGFVGLLLFRSVKPKEKPVLIAEAENGILSIGNTLFNTDKKQLIYAETITELTTKEYNLLLIFAKSPNSMIERTKLQKELWEDEGVIVGRSLDMFISKLRKKLESDNAIKLTNIHGKGYKLELLTNNS